MCALVVVQKGDVEDDFKVEDKEVLGTTCV